MNYEKQNFVNGQVLTAECLNRMEEGIKGACDAVPPACDSADCSKVLSYGKDGYEWINMSGGAVFYETFADAVAGTNAVADGPVKVFTADDGAKTIVLRNAVNVDTPIDITTDTTLILNGYILSLISAAAQFNVNANFVINGEAGTRSGIWKIINIFSGDAARIFNVNSGSLKITGGNYALVGTLNVSAIAINAASNCKEVSMADCTFNVKNANPNDGSITVSNAVTKVIQSQAQKVSVVNSTLTATAYHRCVVALHSAGDVEVINSELNVTKNGTIKHNQNVTCIVTESVNNSAPKAVIENSKLSCVAQSDSAVGLAAYGGTAIIRNSTVFTDAPGATADLNASSIGMVTRCPLTCINTKVVGTHSAISSYDNDLYVDGCTLNGFCHGGLYLMPQADNKVYIKDSALIVGVYEGQFPDDVTTNYACFYFGNDDFSTNGTVYMDGCTLEGNGYLPFVVRQGPDADHKNVLHISNMTDNADTSAPIRLNGYAEGNEGYCDYIGAELKIGVNCPFTPEDTTRPDCAEVTGALYRKTPADMPITGDDFDALQSCVGSQLVVTLIDFDGESGTASHTAKQIYDHVKAGGTAMLIEPDGLLYPLLYVDEYYAGFGHASAEELLIITYDVSDGGTVYAAEKYAIEWQDMYDYCVMKPQQAKVGQTIVVKAVDSKGRPTEWECADLPTIVVANFACYELGDSSSIYCTSHNPLKLLSYLDRDCVPVIAHISEEQGYARTAVCWVHDGELYVGDPWTDSGWHFDKEDGEVWEEY